MSERTGVIGTGAHWRTIVVDYNESAAPYPADHTVLDLFATHVAQTPHAEAIRFGDAALSYADLDRRANQIAARLRDLGVGAEHIVVVAMAHSLEVVCAILGVLKAGAAYAPVDPIIPRSRLAAILADIAQAQAGVRPVLITQSALAHDLPVDADRLLTIDADFAALEGASASAPATAPTPGALAYVIFTSGSTGMPKGVMIQHRSLINYIWWANASYAQGEQLSWPLFSSLGFDLTVTSVFTPLISGGRIVVYGDTPGSHGTAIFSVIRDGVADIVKLTPAHLTMIKRMDLAGTRIRRLIVGGEDFKTELAREITERFGRPVEIYNEYGPTEATVGCMIHRYDATADRALSVPIGRPAANARIYVLDAALHPVAPGIIGEMYLAGDGLARGYFNRPALTETSFITASDPRALVSPESAPASERLYKTGDLARWTPDGRLEFLGRADDQVKINGFRIELGEIEAGLQKVAGVRDAVVAVKRHGAAGDHEGVDRLIGYYVADAELAGATFRAALSTQLPDYMVPSQYVRLERLPITSNGKVDRRHLPDPPPEKTDAPLPTDGARSDVEITLAAIWAELLNVERVGFDDNFFELGGHSLLAMRVLSRIRDAFDIDLPMELVFKQPTVATLAAAIAEARTSAPASAAPQPSVIARRARPGAGRPSEVSSR